MLIASFLLLKFSTSLHMDSFKQIQPPFSVQVGSMDVSAADMEWTLNKEHRELSN